MQIFASLGLQHLVAGAVAAALSEIRLDAGSGVGGAPGGGEPQRDGGRGGGLLPRPPSPPRPAPHVLIFSVVVVCTQQLGIGQTLQ